MGGDILYQIQKEQVEGQKTLLIPAMFDNHFPLMKFAFCSDEYYPVILENTENIVETALQYINNDVCNPCVLNIGQILCALKSGQYDLKNTLLLMPTFGDRCIGSNYTELLKKALKKAQIPDVQVITFSVKSGEEDLKVHMQYFMFLRAFFSMQYGDLLLFLKQQIRPYEHEKGATDACYEKWIATLSEDFRTGKHLSPFLLKKNFQAIIADFSSIKRDKKPKPRIGIVGELFTRYCSLGNRNLVAYLESQGCETFTNGLAYYFLYYIDCHRNEATGIMRFGYDALASYILMFQKIMLKCLKKAGLFAFTDYATLKKQYGKEIMQRDSVGDGWLISLDTYGCIQHGITDFLGVQSFRCIPSHIYGHGQYMSMVRKWGGRIVSLDYDSSISQVNIENRIHLLIDEAKENYTEK